MFFVQHHHPPRFFFCSRCCSSSSSSSRLIGNLSLLFPLPITQFPCSWSGITSHPGSFILGAAVAANPLAISACYSHHPSPSFHFLAAPSPPTQVSLFLVQQQGFQACLSDTSISRFYYSQGKSAMTITTTMLQQQQ